MNMKLLSTIVVMTILCTSFVGVVTTQEIEEPNEIAPVVLAAVILVVGAIGYEVTNWYLNEYLDDNNADVQPYLRLATANDISDVMSVATTFTTNANANYAQIWGMTKEHWIRQAELEAYAEWKADSTYDGNAILLGSYAYENNATMTANAVAQIDKFFGEVSEKVSKWSDTETYNDKMQIGFVLDNNQMLTKSNDFDADLISVFDTQGSTGKVYIAKVESSNVVTVGNTDETTTTTYSPSYIYNFGIPTTITSTDGNSLVLQSGKNILPDDFQSGIYTISNALIGGDSMSPVLDSSKLKAGLAMTVNGSTTVAYLGNDDRIVHSGQKYDKISFLVDPQDIPDGENKPSSVDMKSVLIAYQTLLDKLYWTSVSANTAAEAVWGIYDTMNAANYSVTTFMTSNNFDSSVTLSAGMNQIMTISATQQLAEYYNSNGGNVNDLKIGLYDKNIDAPFVRGSILDEYGNTLYGDVIFTPFFQSESVTLTTSSSGYEVTQSTLVAVWTDGQELTAWKDSGMDADGYQSLFIEDGYTLKVTQLGVCDSSGMDGSLKELEFKVNKVNFIDPGKVNLTEDTDWEKVAKNILKVICIVIGGILALLGVVRRDPMYIIMGVGLLIFGFVFADTVWNWIVKVFKL